MHIAELARQRELFDTRPVRPIDFRRQDKLYFALRPDLEATRRMVAVGEGLIRKHGLHSHIRPVDTFHVSVLGVGFPRMLRREQIAIAEAAAGDIAFEPFRLIFTHSMSYPRNSGANPLVLCAEGDEGVNRLAATLAGAMVARGFRPRGKLGGNAHLTLLYDQALIPQAPLEEPVPMEVSGFFLVRNHHGQGRHENQMFTFRS